ncbi:MAG TPA: twin-arginine translocation signal domain-containing protein, partial [Mycobacterium sp.]
MPVPIGSGPNRRQFLQRAAILAAAAPTLGAFLAACSKPAGTQAGGPSLTIAKPDSPVKWPIADDNKAIADNLTPEKGATLKIYNYADYLSPQ